MISTKGRLSLPGSRLRRRQEEETGMKSRFHTTFRGRQVLVEMDANIASTTVHLTIDFWRPDRTREIQFPDLTRYELAELCRLAADNSVKEKPRGA